MVKDVFDEAFLGKASENAALLKQDGSRKLFAFNHLHCLWLDIRMPVHGVRDGRAALPGNLPQQAHHAGHAVTALGATSLGFINFLRPDSPITRGCFHICISQHIAGADKHLSIPIDDVGTP